MPRPGQGQRPLEDVSVPWADEVPPDKRAAWFLRAARALAPSRPTHKELVSALAARGINTPRYHVREAENGERRRGTVVDGYELALDYQPGHLRAPYDILHRTFRGTHPDDAPGARVTELNDFFQLTDAVLAAPSGIDWLRWARAISQDNARGLPRHVAVELVVRLLGEIGRTTAGAYLTRYEAVAVLRCGPYGSAVLSAAQQVVDDPHVQVLFDLMSAVAELASLEGWSWAVSLLDDPRPHVVHGAVLALENMSGIAGFEPDWWLDVEEVLASELTRWASAKGEKWGSLSQLLHLVPAEVCPELHQRLDAIAMEPDPEPDLDIWDNKHWVQCGIVADEIAERFDLSEANVLGHLLYYGSSAASESRAITSLMLLSCLPTAHASLEALARFAESSPDLERRKLAAWRVVQMGSGHIPSFVGTWANSGGAPHSGPRLSAAMLLAQAGRQVDPEVVASAAGASGSLRRRLLYVAGLSRSPLLERLAASDDRELAGAAGWWIDAGGALDDGHEVCSGSCLSLRD